MRVCVISVCKSLSLRQLVDNKNTNYMKPWALDYMKSFHQRKQLNESHDINEKIKVSERNQRQKVQEVLVLRHCYTRRYEKKCQ